MGTISSPAYLTLPNQLLTLHSYHSKPEYFQSSPPLFLIISLPLIHPTSGDPRPDPTQRSQPSKMSWRPARILYKHFSSLIYSISITLRWSIPVGRRARWRNLENYAENILEIKVCTIHHRGNDPQHQDITLKLKSLSSNFPSQPGLPPITEPPMITWHEWPIGKMDGMGNQSNSRYMKNGYISAYTIHRKIPNSSLYSWWKTL